MCVSARDGIAIAFIAGLTAACGGGGNDAGAPALIQIDGSSTVFPITEAVAEAFQLANPRVRVTVGISGTGGGFQRFCRGETDISDASRPISPTEIDTCAAAGIEYIELPIAYDGLAVVVHPQNTWVDAMTVGELERLWEPAAQNTVLRWSQIRPSWPDEVIHLFGAGVDSGTYDYFTEAIVGEEGVSRGDFTASEDDNVLVQGVTSDEFALGFLPYAYVEQNQSRLKVVPIDDGNPDNGDGPVMASPATVRAGTYQPLSRPLFLYVSLDEAERPEIQQFVEAYFMGADLMREVGYVELTPAIYDLARQHFADRRTGTAFGAGGSQVGLTIEELLRREQ